MPYTKLKVLLIDDDPDDNLIHSAVLEESERCSEVLCFESAAEAYQYFSDTEADQFPNLVFLDINMPRMNGFEFLEKVRGNLKSKVENVTFIMLTTSLNPDDKDRASKYADLLWDYNIKPLSPDVFHDIYENHFLSGEVA